MHFYKKVSRSLLTAPEGFDPEPIVFEDFDGKPLYIYVHRARMSVVASIVMTWACM